MRRPANLQEDVPDLLHRAFQRQARNAVTSATNTWASLRLIERSFTVLVPVSCISNLNPVLFINIRIHHPSGAHRTTDQGGPCRCVSRWKLAHHTYDAVTALRLAAEDAFSSLSALLRKRLRRNILSGRMEDHLLEILFMDIDASLGYTVHLRLRVPAVSATYSTVQREGYTLCLSGRRRRTSSPRSDATWSMHVVVGGGNRKKEWNGHCRPRLIIDALTDPCACAHARCHNVLWRVLSTMRKVLETHSRLSKKRRNV